MVSCKLYRSPCFGKSLRFLAESFNSPVFTAFSSSLSRERDSWEFWQKGCIFITIGGQMTSPPPPRSRISIISLVSRQEFHLFIRSSVRVLAPHLEGLGLVSPPLLALIFQSLLSTVMMITGFSSLTTVSLAFLSDHPKSRTLACVHMITCCSVWHVMCVWVSWLWSGRLTVCNWLGLVSAQPWLTRPRSQLLPGRAGPGTAGTGAAQKNLSPAT